MAQTQPEPLTWEALKKQPITTAFEMTFTPDQARRIVRSTIGTDSNFRKLTEDSRTQQAADQMRRGEWDWRDADPIRLHIHAVTGELVASDGQHRLWAASIARRNLRAMVLFGTEWEAGVHVDRNRTRNVAQYLAHAHGIRGAAPFVAVARFHIARVLAVHVKGSSHYQRNLVTDEAVIAFVVKYQSELSWTLARASVGGARGFNTIAYATMLLEALEIDHELANQFHDDMKNPDLEMLDPLFQLRRIVAQRYSQTGRKAHRDYSIANLVKAWNLRATGQTLTKWINAGDDVHMPAGYQVPSTEQILNVSADAR